MARTKKLITKSELKEMLSDYKKREKIAKYKSLEDFMKICDAETQNYIMVYGVYQLIEAIINPKED